MGNLQEKQSVKQPFRPSADPDSAITPVLVQLYPPPLQFRVDDRGKTEKVAEGPVLQRTISNMNMPYGNISLDVIVQDINGTMKMEKGDDYPELDESEVERVKGYHENPDEDFDIWDVIRAIRSEDFAEDDGSASEDPEPILIEEDGKTFFGLVKPSDNLGNFADDGGMIEVAEDGSCKLLRGLQEVLLDGDYNYCVYVPGSKIVAVGLASQIEHAELANGREKVGFAGEVTIKDGKAVSWNNKSGHFVPVAEYNDNAPFPAGAFTEYG